MKYFFVIFFLILTFTGCQSGNPKMVSLKDTINLEGSKKREETFKPIRESERRSVKWEVVGDSVYIDWQGYKIIEEGDGIKPLHFDKPNKDTVGLYDYDDDGIPELVVLIDDAVMASTSHLRIFKLKDRIIGSIKFYAPNDIFDELIIKNHVVIIDSTGNIFGYTMNTADNNGYGKIQIDKYTWSKGKKGFVYLSSKTFPDFPPKISEFKF